MLLLVPLLAPGLPATTAAAEPPEAGSLRSIVRARLDCRSDVARREITLFANGTVRVRERAVPQSEFERAEVGVVPAPGEGELRMYLGELGPQDLEIYLGRLRREDLAEAEGIGGAGLVGSWIDRCRLEIALPGRPRREFDIGRYDSLSLSLSRVLSILEELPTWVVLDEGGPARIPGDYAPKVGDILQHRDGNRFEVRALTTGGTGVELEGLDQPLTTFILVDDLRSEFRALLQRGGRRRPAAGSWRRRFPDPVSVEPPDGGAP